MKPQTSSLSPVKLLVIGWIAGTLLFTNCTNDVQNVSTDYSDESGAVAVTVNVGKVGVLAKRASIDMKKLILEVKKKSTGDVVASDTSALSGTNETIVKRTIPSLKAPITYTIQAKTIDANDVVIHADSATFKTVPEDTVDVALTMDAKYSMVRTSFNALPDSITKVTLGIAGADTVDSSFAKATRDTVVLEYDYLSADSNGIDHSISLRASGVFYGKDTVLYAADTTIQAKSGVDRTYTITMKWVGPGFPDGAAEMTVTIGAIGTELVNAGFTAMGGPSELVDDLEDGDHVTRYKTYWFTYDDDSIANSARSGNSVVTPAPYRTSGISPVPTAGGALNSSYCMSFSYVLDEGNLDFDPFAGMGFGLTMGDQVDMSSATGIVFYYKGNSSRIMIKTANITDFAYWGYTIPASTDWKLVTLSWSQFSQPIWGDVAPFDRTKAKEVVFEVTGKTGDAGSVWVDDVYLPGYAR